MRRGLLSWNRDEVPVSVLDARLDRCRRAMEEADLPCLLIYTSFPRPAAASWLTHFIPYWSQGLLAVFPDGPPVLIISLSKRVGEWIATTAHIGEIVHSPNPGRAAAELIAGRYPDAARIGVVELTALPGGIAQPLVEGLPRVAMDDATALFAEFRQPADEVEIALSERAAAIASSALDAGIAAADGSGGRAISAIEHHARLAGAEEVMVRLATDLSAGPVLRRIEGDAALGDTYALQVSVAYKGHWVRVLRSIPAADAPPGWAAGESLLTRIVSADPWSDTAAWSVEGCVGTKPLSVLAANDLPGHDAFRAGTVRVVSLRLDLPGGAWLGGLPVLVGRVDGEPARSLLPA